MISVTINLDDKGMFTVGTEPQGEAEGEQREGGTMDMLGGQPEYKPAKNIDDALNQARQLLMTEMGNGEQSMRTEEASKVWPKQMMQKGY